MRKTFSLPVAATAAGGGVTPPPADTVDNIEHSVRFNSADSAYLSRTPSSAGNRRTWTWSGWVKRNKLNTNQNLFACIDASATHYLQISFISTDVLVIYDSLCPSTNSLVTSQVFRDTSAWFHVVVYYNTTESTASDKAKIYVNGQEITQFSTDERSSLTSDSSINRAEQHSIGSRLPFTGGAGAFYGDFTLADIHFIDGQALTPSSFGFTDSNGVWQPKAFTGSYGTNGFHLDFADTSSATALGNDVSGNNNDFTPSGLVAGPAYTANSWSTEFDGNGDYIDNTSNYLISSTTSSFTIESWIYMTANPTNDTLNIPGLITVNSGGGASTTNYMAFGPISTRKLRVRWYDGASKHAEGSTTLALNTWYHVACSVNNNSIKFFVNGVEETLTGTTTLTNRSGDANGFAIGQSYTYASYTGRVSNLRVIDGRALYTAAFTPPSTALTATDDTVLLTCQDATVRDNSNIGHSVTASGDVAVVNEGPFNGYSGDFSSGGSLSIADSTDFTLGTNDFTLEAWCYFTSTSFQLFLGQNDGNVSGSSIDVRYSAGTVTTYAFSGGNAYSATGSAAANVWNHVAWVRDGSTLRLFINGSQTNTSNIGTNSINDSGTTFRIGNNASKFSNVRLTNGQALYTANFTPPTADLTTTSQGATASNVKLLTCQNSTFIDNSPSSHTITVNSNAKTVSVNPHTDKYSVTFDGTGDYLTTSSNTPMDFGTGAFTIEGWVYTGNKTISGGAARTIIGNDGNSYTMQLYIDTSVGNVVFGNTGSTNLQGTSNIANSAWHHIAIVRSGTGTDQTALFVDGVQEAVGTNSQDYTSGTIYIGAFGTTDGFWDGKISNLRITQGQALYTSNFLPSKEDLTTTSQGATASNVKLLTCQSYKIQDNSPSAHTITVNGDAKPSTDAPFVTSGAGSFDGTGDYLTVPSSADWTLGSSGDFTIEGWVYPNSSHNSGIFTTFTSWTTGFANKWAFALAGTTLRWYLDNGGVGLTATLSVGQWSHIAASRSGSTIYLFVNGNLAGTQTANQDYSSQDRLIIGSVPGFGDFNGKISNVRISKGLARYTSNFTPPTEDFDPTDQDTTFLALQGNTLDDLAGDHAVSALGNAATSTVSPFEPVDGSDAMLDSPTNYGSGDTVRGNYCTLNPLFADTYGSAVNGNVEYLNTGGAGGAIASTMAVSSGKWYYETSPTNNAYGSGNPIYPCGFLDLDIFTEFTDTFWYTAGTGFYGYYVRDGRKIVNGTISSFATSSTVNDIIGFALDLDAGELEVYKNGISLGVAATGLTGNYMPCVTSSASGQTGTVNFGQQPFKYPLAGYKSLCSTNLPTPAVADGSTAMDVALYTGTSSALAVSTPNMSPDLVWIKRRNFGWTHRLYDSIRGAGATTALYPNTTDSEGAVNAEDLDSFDSTGFTVGPASPLNGINAIGGTFVAWTWDAGSSTVTNTDGTVASQVRANPTAGISIVYVTANETTGNGGTVGHGLGKKPAFIIQKNTGATANWYIQHSGLGDMSGSYLKFTPAGKATDNTWNISEPTSSVMSIDPAYVDGDSNADVIYYVFAPVEGFSSFGTYTGSTSNTFVYTGMRPRWLMIKRTDTTSDWVILDTEREGYNVDNDPLWANLTNQEGTTDIADILSNGFKMRDGATGDYIYAAFAEHPFKTSRAR